MKRDTALITVLIHLKRKQDRPIGSYVFLSKQNEDDGVCTWVL
jgi:hypothetical protein